MPFVEALAAELPAIEALDSLRHHTELVMAAGRVKDERRMLKEWWKTIDRSAKAPAINPTSNAGRFALAAMGIGVVIEEPRHAAS